MPLNQDRHRALELLSLDQNWVGLKSGQTLSGQALALLAPAEKSEPCALRSAISALAELVEADGQARADQGHELDYHNRDHIRDTLVALNLLLKATPHSLAREDREAIILAMLGHDLGHKGLPNQWPRELETRSWGMVYSLLKPLTLEPKFLRQIRTIILMTDPKDYPRLAERRRHSVLSTQIGLAVDADLFASLLPSRGFFLGSRLADEQVKAGLPQAKGFATLKGRAMFLKSAPLLSDALGCLGMRSLIDAQLSVIAQLTEAEGQRLWTPSWGKAFAALVFDHLKGQQ